MPDIKTNIKLSGEAEYKRALSEINAGMKVLKSEMQLTGAQFAASGKSVDALKAKNDVLTRSISSQEDKLRLMREQLQKTAQSYGEGSTKTMQLQAAVNKAEAELVEMKNELKSNTEAMQKTERQSDSLGSKFQDVADKLGAKLPAGAQKAIGALKNVDAGLAAAATGAGLLVAGIVKVEKTMISMTKEAASAADELVTMSQQMGVSTQALQEFQYAADAIDVSVDTIQSSLTKLTSSMARGSEQVEGAFLALQVSVRESNGHLRDAKDVFFDVIDALGEIHNQTARDALAMDIFGKSAQDLNPLIAAGSEELKRLAAEAKETGYVLDDLSLKKLTSMDDALQKLDKTTEAFKKQMSAEFAPYVTEAVEKVQGAFKALGGAVVDSGAAEAMGMILQSTLKILDPLDQLNNGKLPALQTALNVVAQTCAVISDTMNTIMYGLGAIGSVYTFQFGKAGKYFEGLKTSIGWYGTNNLQTINTMQARAAAAREARASSTWSSLGDTLSTYTAPDFSLPEYNVVAEEDFWARVSAGLVPDEEIKRKLGMNAAGTSNWRGGWSWVGENGPELAYLPAGSTVKTASESRETGDNYWNISINARDVKEFNDIVQIAKTARQRLRKAEVS